MPQYSISTGQPTLQTTNTSLVLGYGPNMTAPPDLLLWNCSAGGTVTLPAINPVLPSPPTTPGTSAGVSDGFSIKIKNQTGNALTITPAGADTIDGYALSNINDFASFQASTTLKNWYNLSTAGAGTIRTVAGAATVATTDRYLIISAAAAVTLPAPSNFPVGVPFVTIADTSSGSVTVTPASGNINGQAALTITTATSATLLGDGTNFYRSA